MWSIVEDIRNATLESFWTGPREQFIDDEYRWYELWIHQSVGRSGEVDFLIHQLNEERIPYKNNYLTFPEKVVILVYLNSNKLKELIINVSSISEVRPASNINNFLFEIDRKEQNEWVTDLIERLSLNTNENETFITILDGGVNYNSPLLSPFIGSNDHKVFDPNWGIADGSGHGSNMAGVAAYFNLSELLASDDLFQINHKLESGKIMEDSIGGNIDPQLYGAIINQVVSDLIIEFPERVRIYCMAVTGSNNTIDDGRPTSWSAAIDNLAKGVVDGEEKIFIISAGNIREDLEAVAAYPHTQQVSSIENPGQSWNAITVGAITDFPKTLEDGNENVADCGQLSPFTRTSLTWDQAKWPIKPEIVLEGGNARLIENQGFTSFDNGVITASSDFSANLFDVMHGTSPATAKASYIAAELQNKYPEAWPETIRALMIHSASWTPQIEAQLLESSSKTHKRNVLRSVGYGIPSLEKAIQCVEKRVNIIVQSDLQPFQQKDNGSITAKDMKIFKIPWPKTELEGLHDKEVTLKVTLSYFIEAGPGEKGWNNRYRYSSVGLRFDINGPLDDKEIFLQRVNQMMIDDGQTYEGSGSINWKYGKTSRDVGSIHSDSWTATGAEIANSEYIAVFPVTGWWKERKNLEKYNDRIRFSLVVSVETNEEIDIYNPILNQIHIPLTV